MPKSPSFMPCLRTVNINLPLSLSQCARVGRNRGAEALSTPQTPSPTAAGPLLSLFAPPLLPPIVRLNSAFERARQLKVAIPKYMTVH